MIKIFTSNHLMKLIIFISLLFFVIYSLLFSSVKRTIEEDEFIKKGFDPKSYVEKIWESKIIPTIINDSNDIEKILDELFINKEIAEEKYGHRSGTGSYSFMVKGKGTVISLNDSSRVGTLSIKLDKNYDSEILLTIGPVIKKDSIRDSVGFIKFNDFVNQLDFADVSRIIKTRVLNEIIGLQIQLDNSIFNYIDAFNFSFI